MDENVRVVKVGRKSLAVETFFEMVVDILFMGAFHLLTILSILAIGSNAGGSKTINFERQEVLRQYHWVEKTMTKHLQDIVEDNSPIHLILHRKVKTRRMD